MPSSVLMGRALGGVLVAVVSLFGTGVSSYSTGAGSCIGGEPAVGDPHRSASLVYQGTLKELTYDLKINGESILGSKTTTTTNRPLPLMETHTDYVIELHGALARFRGALIRVEVADADEDVVVELIPAKNAAVAAACEALDSDNVVGITHTDGGVKQTLSGILRVADPTDNLLIDVTVVGANDADYSMFGYSGVSLTVVDIEDTTPTTTSTDSPTASPTVVVAADITSPPTALRGPTTNPTVVVTKSPTVGPTSSPTRTPTLGPTTSSPSRIPTSAPITERPTSVPIMERPTPMLSPETPSSPDPPTNPAPVFTGDTPQTHVTLQQLELRFEQVAHVSVDGRFQWERLTTEWFEQFYAEIPVDGVVLGSMSTVIHAQSSYSVERDDDFYFVLTYDQELSYTRTNDKDAAALQDPFLLAALPFRNENQTADYLASLATEVSYFNNTESVSGPEMDKIDSDLAIDRIGDSALVWIVVVLFFLVVCGGLLFVMQSNTMKSSAPDNFPDTFSFMGSMGGSKKYGNDAMSVRSFGTTKDASKKYVVYAPSGKLLLVLEVEDNGVAPTVKSIQEDSPLLGKIDIGDYLVAVDEVDVQGMSADKVSKLISNRRANPVRKLSLIRGEVVKNEIQSVAAESIGDSDGDSVQPKEASFSLSDGDDDDDFLGGRSNL